MDRPATLELLILDARWRPRQNLASSVDWRLLVRRLLAADARWIALRQRHGASRPAAPDAQDIALTRCLGRRLRPLGIRLADHVIETPVDRFSFRDAGLL